MLEGTDGANRDAPSRVSGCESTPTSCVSAIHMTPCCLLTCVNPLCNRSMDVCLAALAEVCPDQRGTSFACLDCAAAARPALEKACGNFSVGDNRQGWGVHFYCGTGWSVNALCIQHVYNVASAPSPRAGSISRLQPLTRPCMLTYVDVRENGDGSVWVQRPGSSFQRSPMTEYCVEHAEAPQTDPTPGGDGYAQCVPKLIHPPPPTFQGRAEAPHPTNVR